MMFVVFYVFASYSSALHTSLARVQGFSLMITTHNSTALKVNGMTEDILFVVLFAQRVFASGYQTQKGPIFIPTIFLFFFFLSSDMHQSCHLDGCRAMGKSSSFIEAF